MASTTPPLTFLLTVFFMFNSFPTPSLSCPVHQRQALVHFKSTLTAIMNSSSDLESWNLTFDCCSWERVNCTETGTVVELHLDGLVPPPDISPVPVYSDILTSLFHIRSLELLDISSNFLLGKIPGAGFHNLTKLVHLYMVENRFNGSIPSQIFRLKNLRYLDLSFNWLEEKLEPRLGSLQNLIELRLSNNYFHGPIPPQLFELKSLQWLDLSDNILEGVLSPQVGKLQNLESLLLMANFLSGEIPEEIGNLTKLLAFSLQKNRFRGEIPSSVANLKKLEILDLSENLFSRQIPNFIGTSLLNMIALDLGKNKFTGPIPSSMQNLSTLEVLRLHDNMLMGEIPYWLFNITTLRTLFIGGEGSNLIWNNKAKIVPKCSLTRISMPFCGISGQIPVWVSSHKDLFYLDLSGNKLEGGFPGWLAERNFQVISLSDNILSGSIPSRLFEYVDLLYLDLSRNNFSGGLPKNIGNAKRIYVLSLSENKFSGQIPASISRIDTLAYLDLSNNMFSGTSFPVWGDKSKLESLDLSYNKFSGKIPTHFPKGIRYLYVGGNKFSGNLPWNFTKLTNLKLLDIHDNNITGSLQDTLPQIPTLEALILRNNSLQGYIPINISNLSSLRILDLSWNNLTGSIPRELETLPKMIEIQNIPKFFPVSHPIWVSQLIGLTPGDLIVNWKKSFQGLAIRNLDVYALLDLSHNKITGEIPPSLGNLKAMKLLSISHNKISGYIPVSFGNLVNLESLDLSHNEISGLIPQSLVKLNQLTVLDVSNNMLTGKIPVGGQMTTMNELNYFANNSGLCGIQIRVLCPDDIPRPEAEGKDDQEDKKQTWFTWKAAWVGFPVGLFSSILMSGYFMDFLKLFISL